MLNTPKLSGYELLASSTRLLPYLLGPLIAEIQLAPEQLNTAGERLVSFFLLCMAWKLLRVIAAARFIRVPGANESTQAKQPKRWIDLLVFLVATLVTLALLHLFRSKVSDNFFYLALAALALLAASDSLRLKEKNEWSSGVHLIGYVLIGLVSMVSVTLQISWEGILFCVALGAMVGAVSFSEHLSLRKETPASDSNRRPKAPVRIRLTAIMLTLGPVLIGGLVFMDRLPSEYLLAFASVLISSRLISRWPTSKRERMDPRQIITAAALSTHLFFLGLVGGRLIQLFS